MIYKIDDNQCCVQLKETYRSAKNQQLQSFPSKKINNQFNLDEDIILETDIPLGIVSTDEDDDEDDDGLETVMKKIESSDS